MKLETRMARLEAMNRAGPTLSRAARVWLGEPLSEVEAVHLAQSGGELSPAIEAAAHAALTLELQAWLDERREPDGRSHAREPPRPTPAPP